MAKNIIIWVIFYSNLTECLIIVSNLIDLTHYIFKKGPFSSWVTLILIGIYKYSNFCKMNTSLHANMRLWVWFFLCLLLPLCASPSFFDHCWFLLFFSLYYWLSYNVFCGISGSLFKFKTVIKLRFYIQPSEYVNAY